MLNYKIKISAWMILILLSSSAVAAGLWQKFDKNAYYEAIASNSREVVNKELSTLQALQGNEKEAYEGALLMKKAGLEILPKDKLHYFKAGRIQLETAIQAENANVEYHFLRLIIEEHAPKIVKYKADLAADAELVKKNYKSLPPAVQHAILDYSKSSKILHPQDF